MVKIFRKVAVECSREVEIIGGGVKLFLGGGELKHFGEHMELFPWCRVFSWELQFFLWFFFLWLALFFDEDISSTDLRPNLEAIYVPLKLTRQKMTMIPKKKISNYLKPFLLYSLSTIVDSRSQCI